MYHTRAQGVVEYVIILAAIVGAIIIASQALIKPALDDAMVAAGDKVEKQAGEFLLIPHGWE